MSNVMQRDLELEEAVMWRWRPDSYAQRVSGGAWFPFHYLQHISTRIMAAIRSGRGRVIVNMPPRHGKSEFISRWLPTWFIDKYPQRHVTIAGHSEKLALDHGRVVRNILAVSPLTMTKLAEDSKAAGRWHTTEGGSLRAVGVNTGIFGFGYHLGIIDDPYGDMAAACKRDQREQLEKWFTDTFYNRQEPGASIIVLHHRLHEEDFTEFLLNRHADNWDHIRLPALAEDGDPLGRLPGEALCPHRYNEASLREMKAGTPTASWNALYQQRPDAFGRGRVYSHFTDANLHPGALLNFREPLHLSFDFNINPGMHLVIGQYDRERDEILAIDEIHDQGMSIIACMDAFEAWLKRLGGWKFPELHIFGDRSGRARRDTTGESGYALIRTKLRAMNIPHMLRVPEAVVGLRDSIDTFNEAIRDQQGAVHYRVHPYCKRLIADMKGLKTDDEGLIDKRDEELSHASDAERYRVYRIRPLNRIVLPPQRVGY